MFSEDVSQFFALPEFAVACQLFPYEARTRAIPVIFDEATHAVELYDTGIEEPAPQFLAQTTDLHDLRRGNQVRIGAWEYTVARLAHDGTGVSTVYLEHPKAAPDIAPQ